MNIPIRIASGKGFWGDLQRAPLDQAQGGPIDYLVMDYLAEVTMSILHKQKARDADRGYAHDFPDTVAELLPLMRTDGFKVIANAGGANPLACRDHVLELAGEQRIQDICVAVVTGDDVVDRLDELIARGVTFDHMETGAPISSIRSRIVSANAYLGAAPIVEALRRGADIVITGRITDAALTLAPLIYEFDWAFDDWNRLAAGTIAGHILECGAQASGGNFTDWETVPDLARIGFPIVEAGADGTFVVTKHPDTGGRVSEATVKEQLVYEIADPASYLTPDCTADFTSVQLAADGADRVRVSGIKGRPATDFYKVSAAYRAGWKTTGTLIYSWPNAPRKARAAGEILRQRLHDLGFEFDEYRVELVGLNALEEDAAPDFVADEGALNEVMLHVSVRSGDRAAVDRFSREIAPLVLSGPSGVTGYGGRRPRPSEVFAYWPTLVPKELVQSKVDVQAVDAHGA